jgi:hypothetical protein
MQQPLSIKLIRVPAPQARGTQAAGSDPGVMLASPGACASDATSGASAFEGLAGSPLLARRVGRFSAIIGGLARQSLAKAR